MTPATPHHQTLAEAAWTHYAAHWLKTMARCADTDLPVTDCACPTHHRPSSTVVTAATLERLAGRPLPQVRYRRRDPRWKVQDPKTTVCDHRKDGALCGPCTKLLDAYLADIPALMAELGTAERKDTRFPAHGHRKGDIEHPDESPLPWNPAATRLLARWRDLIGSDWYRDPTNRPALLAEISDLATRTHRLVDRPADRAMSICPDCRDELALPDKGGRVVCRNQGCAYSASWEQHQTDLLDANEDVMLTAAELVGVLCKNGEPITRQRVSYLVERHGLPREKIVHPEWDHGRIVTKPQFVYRLRDVRALQDELSSTRAAN